VGSASKTASGLVLAVTAILVLCIADLDELTLIGNRGIVVDIAESSRSSVLALGIVLGSSAALVNLVRHVVVLCFVI
jgi:hypothetical protein